jgi:limonene-1,2-epoxide hydrolase
VKGRVGAKAPASVTAREMVVGNPLDVVFAWEKAVSAADGDGACALSDEDIEVGEPRGSGRGHQVVRDLIARRSELALELLRTFQRDGIAVIEHRAIWKVGDGSRSATVIGTVFKVSGGRVVSVVRYDTLEEALTAAGLSLGSEYIRLTP